MSLASITITTITTPDHDRHVQNVSELSFANAFPYSWFGITSAKHERRLHNNSLRDTIRAHVENSPAVLLVAK